MSLIPKTGEELSAARKAASERLTLLAHKHTPEGVAITYHESLSGRAWPTEWRMIVPKPTTRRRLHIYLHEVAHIVLNHVRKKPRHVEEMEAEKWAFRVMREEGVAVPRVSRKRAKRYVARKIRQAKARGAKRINAEAAAFAR